MKKIIVLILLVLLLPLGAFAEGLGPEDVVIEYFDRLYDGYIRLEPHDIFDLLDQESSGSAAFARSYQMLIERRKYIEEKDYCYVERERFPLDVLIEEVYNDGDFATVVFMLEHDPDKAYPTLFYPGRNIFHLVKQAGKWRISSREHATIDFYPNPRYVHSRDYDYDQELEILKKSIDAEFNWGKKKIKRDLLFPAYGVKNDPLNYGFRPGDYVYDPLRAKAYIDRYIYDRNENYMSLQENCANFSSQIIYYGFFGEEYPFIGAWNALGGGFTENWIYVGLLMDYMTAPRQAWEMGPRSLVGRTIHDIGVGGIIEIKGDANETYAHTMQLWDYQKMIFSGNNYDGYRYYSDFMGYKRFYMPLFFRF